MKRILAAAAIGLAGSASGALAQAPCEAICKAAVDQEVVYAAPVNEQAGGTVAGLSVVGGQVLQSAAAGFTPIESEAGLRIGDQVMLVEGGQVTLRGPANQAQLSGPAVLNVLPAGNCGCVTRERLVTLAQQDDEDQQVPTELIIGGVVAAGVVGILIFALDDDDDAPFVPVAVSP